MSSLNKLNRLFVLLTLTLFLFEACDGGKVQETGGTDPVDLVYNHLDTENSRWFFFSSACRPFGMVNLSPDTQIGGAWGSGYRYNTDTVKGFSHIHAWQLSGLSLMPVAITDENREHIFVDFHSHFSHETEVVSPGYHRLELDRYGIEAELSSTKRVGFHKYTFNGEGQPALLLNLNTLLGPCQNMDGKLEPIGEKALRGELTNEPTRRRPKLTKVFFQIDFDTEILELIADDRTGNYLVIFNNEDRELLLKAGISYTSKENAAKNIKAELDHWEFPHVVKESREEWNGYLSRIQVEGGSEQAQKRFYTDLWHALQGRRIISDVNGSYPDYTGEKFRIGKLPQGEDGKPRFNHYNSDSFWGAQWTLNTLWGLVYPEIMKEFVESMMVYYRDGGMLPRGPSGGNYTFVMTGASTTPFIVSAIQKGIVTENLHEIYEALKKNHMPGGIMGKAGYEHDTDLGGGLEHYMEKGYVPYPIPEGNFGFHQDGASLTLEYAYQDWTLAQLAKKLEMEEDYQYFLDRSFNYRNVYDSTSTWMRPKDIHGTWLAEFDPYIYEHGFNESNGAQSTWFVPHDIPGLASLMGGKEKAVQKLNEQFEQAEKLGFTSGSAHDHERHPEYRRIPINYGNQPSIQSAWIFSLLDRPDLSHYWTKKVVEKAFSGLSPATGYNGDEDQGLMGSLSVLMKIGLFQMNGGTEENPEYLLGSPVFDRVSIQLHPDFYPGNTFLIEADEDSPSEIKNITHKEITGGGQAPNQEDVLFFSYFKGNGEDGLHLAYSENGYQWKTLNNDEPFLKPVVGESKLMRDPCIIYGPDKLFHMVWTAGWNERGIGYAHSKDLINWSEQLYIPVMQDEESALNCWAPEIIYDDINEEYLIFWSTTLSDQFPETRDSGGNKYNHRMYAVTTTDFSEFSETRLFYDHGFNVIDGSILKLGRKDYILFLKDETKVPVAEKNIRWARAQQIGGPYSKPSEPITGDYWAEGPTCIRTGDKYIVYFDKYRKGSMGAVESKDLVRWEDISDRISFQGGVRHGTVFKVPFELARKLMEDF